MLQSSKCHTRLLICNEKIRHQYYEERFVYLLIALHITDIMSFGNDPIPQRDGPAFWVARDDVWSPLLYSAFLARFKSALRQVGLDPNLFAAHSFRRGGATRAFAMGLPGELIRVMGDWRSDAYQGYLDFPLQTRVQAMAAFVSDLPTSY